MQLKSIHSKNLAFIEQKLYFKQEKVYQLTLFLPLKFISNDPFRAVLNTLKLVLHKDALFRSHSLSSLPFRQGVIWRIVFFSIVIAPFNLNFVTQTSVIRVRAVPAVLDNFGLIFGETFKSKHFLELFQTELDPLPLVLRREPLPEQPGRHRELVVSQLLSLR
jgi:hypothetical protein